MKKLQIAAIVSIGVVMVGVAGYFAFRPSSSAGTLRVAVPPFVDTAMTTVGERSGIFRAEGLSIKLTNTTWEGQYDLLAGGALDISMSTLDEFVIKDKNLNSADRGVVYFLPAWQFRGLGFYTSGKFKSLAELQRDLGPEAGKAAFISQLKGKKIAVPEGSVFEAGIKQFLVNAGVQSSDVTFINTPLDAALNSLSDSDVVLAAVGSQQRFEAERRHHKEAVSPEALGLDVVTGFVVRREIWEKRRPEVIKFACSWYKIVGEVNGRPDKGYGEINDYLSKSGAGTLTPTEYAALRQYNVFAATPADAKQIFFSPTGVANWQRVWDRSVSTMKADGRGDQVPLNEDDFVGDEVKSALEASCVL